MTDLSRFTTNGGLDKRAFRRFVSRQAAKANKRIKRLEQRGFENSPAYQKFVDETNGQYFGVKGKDFNEIQTELSKINRFLDAKTSTITGLKKVLKDMADNTGITYNNMRELENKADKFFELAAKVEEYLRQTDDIATAIGYQKIWEAINTYHKRNDLALDSAEKDVDDMIEAVSQLAKEIGSSKNDPTGSNPGETFDGIWFKIPGFN